jgi:hypothetical protein
LGGGGPRGGENDSEDKKEGQQGVTVARIVNDLRWVRDDAGEV